jgi:transcriptional regulator with XRE-family HTH domain
MIVPEVRKVDFLERLRTLALDKGFENNSQLAKASGVPYTTLDNFYRIGYDNAKLSTLKKLAACLGCSLDYLVDGESTEVCAAPTEQEIRRLIVPYRQLDDWGRKTVDAVLEIESSRCQQGSLELDTYAAIDALSMPIEDADTALAAEEA